MNTINPRKLLRSKWTAVEPHNREKHFMVIQVEYDDAGSVVLCLLEAVLSRRTTSIDWRELKCTSQWQHGWK